MALSRYPSIAWTPDANEAIVELQLGPYLGAYWMACLRSDLDEDAVAAGTLDEI